MIGLDPNSAHPEPVEGSAMVTVRDLIETAIALTAAALFGAFIAVLENWL